MPKNTRSKGDEAIATAIKLLKRGQGERRDYDIRSFCYVRALDLIQEHFAVEEGPADGDNNHRLARANARLERLLQGTQAFLKTRKPADARWVAGFVTQTEILSRSVLKRIDAKQIARARKLGIPI